MQKLHLKNTGYQYLEIAFKEWLDVLGYGNGTVKGMPIIVREFLHYLENNEVQSINQLQQKNIKQYHQYISTRANQRRGGSLSNNYINKHVQAVEKFLEFLHHKGTQNVPASGIRLEKLHRKEITILTQSEIKELFELTSKEANTEKEQIVQSRDKALLTIFYSCGLRRNEGVHLSIDDINFDTRILHVKKGKNYKERLVPLNKTNASYLQEWIYDYRSQIIKRSSPLGRQGGAEHRLFINLYGEPMTGGALYSRLKLLLLQSDNIELQQKNIGLHSLRHSIATHLLQAGMSIEKIATFLGRGSLESTQIYTHLLEKE
jgi:integrase/recombinase XerD